MIATQGLSGTHRSVRLTHVTTMHGSFSVQAVLPSAVETQRRVSRAVFEAVSTGSTVQRESVDVVRSVSLLPLDVVEGATGADVHRTVDARFEAAQEVSDAAEDHVLSAMLSTSQVTAEYAELVDESVEVAFQRVEPTPEPASD